MDEHVDAPAMPTQSQLLLPLLNELHAAGGSACPGELYDRIAARIGLDDAARTRTVKTTGDREFRIFDRSVRWTRQTAVAKGLIDGRERGRWELTDRANAQLQNIVAGAIVTVFETDAGIALWATCESAVGLIERNSVSLIVTSPPYPLIKEKNYGNRGASDWVEWMLRLCAGWREILTEDGSLMLNLGTCWIPGVPAQSLYMERLLVRLEDALGLHLCQRLDWHSPTKLPAPMEWVSVRRVRVKPSVEPIFWLAPNPHLVRADNRRVLTPYKTSSLRAIAHPQDGTRTRPSGFTFGPTSFVDRGGAIPPSLITAANSASNSAYRRAERRAGRTPHPAMMPDAVAEFVVNLASEKDDVVWDPFLGGGTTALACERLGRRWIANDQSLEFLTSARINLEANGVATRLINAA